MADTFSKPSNFEQNMKWSRIWFNKFAAFHNIKPESAEHWDFTEDQVIAYLRSKRDTKTPAWKRLKILQGLMDFRSLIQGRKIEFLIPIRNKMNEIILIERGWESGSANVEEEVGYINPKESDAIQVFRTKMRRFGLKKRTESSYVGKVKAFMAARGLTCLSDFETIGSADVEAHLTDLAVDGDVAPSTQNAAFHGLLKFFELVLEREMGKIEAIRAKKHKYIPTILSPEEISSVLAGLEGTSLVIAKLLYGCGMRISEALRLRVKDLDFANGLIQIHQSKGDRSRYVTMPKDLVEPLARFLRWRAALHDNDLANGKASVWLPHALSVKYPNAHRELRWQYLFASARVSRDPRTRKFRRHHMHFDTFPKHLRKAVEAAGILKHVTCHTFRHCFATHLLRSGTDIRTIQQLLGHQDVATTMIYTHVVESEDVVSPLDRLKDFANSERRGTGSDEPPTEVRSERSTYSVCEPIAVG